MKTIGSLSFIVSLLIGLTGNSQNLVSGSIQHGGITRTFQYYVPAIYNSNTSVPLVLNLHGYTSNASQQAAYTKFHEIADTANFITVYPDGTIQSTTNQRFWNFGIYGETVDDKGFLEALIDHFSNEYNINQNKIYCTGMSNGGYMSYLMACESAKIAKIGCVTGSMSLPMYINCNSLSAKPIIHIHGTADNVVSYTGNTTSKAVEDVVAFWANRNGCNATPNIYAIPNTNTSDGATAERWLYNGSASGNTVELFKVIGGGHTWPGAIHLGVNGNTCQDFNASKEIWRFFNNYTAELSIAKLENNQKVIYPNPTNGLIQFDTELDINLVEVTDLQGRLIQTIQGNNLKQINLENLENGNYIVKLQTQTGEFVHQQITYLK